MTRREKKRRLERERPQWRSEISLWPAVRDDTHYLKWTIPRGRGCCLVTTDADYTKHGGLTKKKKRKKKKEVVNKTLACLLARTHACTTQHAPPLSPDLIDCNHRFFLAPSLVLKSAGCCSLAAMSALTRIITGCWPTAAPAQHVEPLASEIKNKYIQ